MKQAHASHDTRQRLLDAAARLFAQQGLEGATTREIARLAAVNEVTLFRHFHSKEKLLAAVLQRTFAPQEDAPDGAATAETGAPAGECLRRELRQFADRYRELLHRNILLVRTLLGEIHRHREHETRVLRGIFGPLKAELLATIKRGQAHGTVRAAIDPVIAADMFSSVVFFDVLKRSLPHLPEYAQEPYLDLAVDVFVRGIEA